MQTIYKCEYNMAKVVKIEYDGIEETYDIWNKEPDCIHDQGNFVIDGLVVHNSILANGVKRFEDLLFYNAAGHPGPMQCCWSHSLVNINNGVKKILELDSKIDIIKCVSIDGDIIETNKYKVISSGRKKLLRIRLKNGVSLIVTSDHKIKTKLGFVKAGELQRGQCVAVCAES